MERLDSKSSPPNANATGTSVTLFFQRRRRGIRLELENSGSDQKYSNHIAFPIFLTYDKSEWNEEEKKSLKKRTTEQVNSASALWKRSKSELKDDDYKEFYKTLTGDWEEPLFWFHTKAEGTQEYTTLFYVPSKAPFDMNQADYKPGVKTLRQTGLHHRRRTRS